VHSAIGLGVIVRITVPPIIAMMSVDGAACEKRTRTRSLGREPYIRDSRR
jgi:hypothetical protein